jgi:hypothetical protein
MEPFSLLLFFSAILGILTSRVYMIFGILPGEDNLGEEREIYSKSKNTARR